MAKQTKRKPPSHEVEAANTRRNWVLYAEQHLLGRKIVGCRYMTDAEAASLGWSRRAVVLRLDNGTLLFPAADDEGNGPGALFGNERSGTPGQPGADLTFPMI